MYLITSDITIPAGVTLTIDPGVVVKFNPARRLTIQGTYVPVGTAGTPIAFTSYRDDVYGGDTNGDGPSSGARGDWAGIFFSTNNNTFENAIVRYAGLNIAGPTVAIRNVTFDYTPDPATRIQRGGAGSSVRNVNFLNWTGNGVRNDTTNSIDARHNYWGDPSGPSGVGPGSGAGVTNNVLYSPWQESPVDMTRDGPVITSTPNTAAVMLHAYHYDADRRPSATGTGELSWFRMLGPTDLLVDPNTGEISWLPTEPGQYVVGIAVADAVGWASQIWQINVAIADQPIPPTIVSHTHELVEQGDGLLEATLISTFSRSVQVRPVDAALLDSLN